MAVAEGTHVVTLKYSPNVDMFRSWQQLATSSNKESEIGQQQDQNVDTFPRPQAKGGSDCLRRQAEKNKTRED